MRRKYGKDDKKTIYNKRNAFFQNDESKIRSLTKLSR